MIVVTGATGTVGSRLVDLLLGRAEPVRVFCRNGERARTRFGWRVEVAEGDWAAAASVADALTGADRVFLLTAGAPEADAQLEHERTVIAAAVRAGVGHVVKLSALGADEQAPIRYARTHRIAELELVASGLPYTILRPQGFMQGVLESAPSGIIPTCAGDGRVALVDAGDIAAVAAEALTSGGHACRTYTLTGPEALTFDEMAAALSRAAGREINHVRMSPAAFAEMLAGMGVPPWLAEDLATTYGIFAAGQGVEVSDDIAAVTGRQPRTFDAFAREEFADLLAADTEQVAGSSQLLEPAGVDHELSAGRARGTG